MAVVQPCARVRLFFRAEQLADKDVLSKSDPYLVLYKPVQAAAPGPMMVPGLGSAPIPPPVPLSSRPLIEVGRTETIADNLNPIWRKTLELDFFFEAKQEFLFRVFDDDGARSDNDNDLLAVGEFQLAHVLGSRKHTLKVQIGVTSVYITAEELSKQASDLVGLTFYGKNMKKMDTFGLSDPYFILRRVQPNGTKTDLHKSNVHNNTLEPKWNACPRFVMAQLCGSSMDEESLEIEVFDEDTFSDDFIGGARFSFHQLLKSATTPIALRRPNKEKLYGEVMCDVKIQHFPTFAEYLEGGLEMNLAVSIDFTGSNGDPRDPRSLHHLNPMQPNQYATAIMAVGEVLLQYDTDKMIAAFGFGAMLPSRQTSHFFHLNLAENPYVHGVEGVMGAYSTALRTVGLSGPTNFAPTIANVTLGASNTKNVYTILLIITDGEITDMDQTVDAIVAADVAPLSIIIVGVGNGSDFAMMKALDGDEAGLISSRGQRCRRDLVQFVPFRDFVQQPPQALAAEVLREIPEQVVQWARLTQYTPPRPPSPSPQAQAQAQAQQAVGTNPALV